jgi:hypothetical protein
MSTYSVAPSLGIVDNAFRRFRSQNSKIGKNGSSGPCRLSLMRRAECANCWSPANDRYDAAVADVARIAGISFDIGPYCVAGKFGPGPIVIPHIAAS